MIQITLNEGRKTDVKKSFDAMVADLLRGESKKSSDLGSTLFGRAGVE